MTEPKLLPRSKFLAGITTQQKMAAAAQGDELPIGLFRFALLLGVRHQVAIAALAIVAFICGTAPLEIQRRIVNDAVGGASLGQLVLLVSIYLGVALAEGAAKLLLNLYRSWLGEVAVRWLRQLFLVKSSQTSMGKPDAFVEGVDLSIVLAEADPVGGFVGTIVSEPLLQAGILAAVTAYMVFLQPLITLAVAITFFPQIGFVPVMQRAINRRVEARIKILRLVSQGMVENFGNDHDLESQTWRVRFVFSTNMSIYWFKFVMNFMMNYMTQLGYGGILLLGGYYVLTGRTEMGTVVAFVSGLGKITDPWGELIDWYRDLKVTQVKYRLIRNAAGHVAAETLETARPKLRIFGATA